MGAFLKNVGVFLNVIGKPLEDVEHNCWSAAAKTGLEDRVSFSRAYNSDFVLFAFTTFTELFVVVCISED